MVRGSSGLRTPPILHFYTSGDGIVRRKPKAPGTPRLIETHTPTPNRDAIETPAITEGIQSGLITVKSSSPAVS
jgi:hypothetical protein